VRSASFPLVKTPNIGVPCSQSALTTTKRTIALRNYADHHEWLKAYADGEEDYLRLEDNSERKDQNTTAYSS